AVQIVLPHDEHSDTAHAAGSSQPAYIAQRPVCRQKPTSTSPIWTVIADPGCDGRRSQYFPCCDPGALDVVWGSRHRPQIKSSGGSAMRALFKPLKKPGLAALLAVLLGLFAGGPAANAANPFELNFWLSGPRYDGQLAP